MFAFAGGSVTAYISVHLASSRDKSELRARMKTNANLVFKSVRAIWIITVTCRITGTTGKITSKGTYRMCVMMW